MDEPAAFSISAEPGKIPAFTEPIPRQSILALQALLDPRLREFMVLENGDELLLLEHRFQIVGWISREPGPALIVQHRCCL